MYEELKTKLVSLPQTTKDEELKLVEINKEVERINGQKKYWQRKISAQIYNDKDTDGKRIYTNDALREAELDARLSLLPDYQQLIELESQQSQLAKLSKIEIDYLERDFKSLQFLIKLLEIER